MKKLRLLLLPVLFILTGCTNRTEYLCSNAEVSYGFFAEMIVTKSKVCMNVAGPEEAGDNWQCFDKQLCDKILVRRLR